MENPLVSVIMSTLNQGDLIAGSIESVLGQSFKDLEFIIVNDGSTDNTSKIIEDYRIKDNRIVYIDNGRNIGVPESFNKAVRASKGKYIARIDSDDIWLQNDKLEKQIDFLEKNPAYMAVGGGMVVRDARGEELYRYLKPEKDQEIRNHALITNPVANSTSLCRKEAIIKAGLCDEDLDYNEDWDFWLKIGLLGKFYNFPEYFSFYTMSGKNKSMVYLRQHTYSALKIILKYRTKYPNFLKGFSVNSAQFIYSLIPFGIRKFFNPILSQIKKILAGSKTK